jgi:hypothetical protein
VALVHAVTRPDQWIMRTTLGALAAGLVQEPAAEDRPVLLVVGTPAEEADAVGALIEDRFLKR